MKIKLIAGPCAVESKEQALRIAEAVHQAGADYYRGGIFKPRSNPAAFQGLGEEGVEILNHVRAIMPVVSEATQEGNVDIVSQCADVIQIGSRNMHNAGLLRAAGKTGKAVMIKRGYAALIREEWLMAIGYVKDGGGGDIWMCERGIRTFETLTRNTLDLSAIGGVKRLYDYPVIIDPSHATGDPDLVVPFALAGIAAGCDGVMIEVHDNPPVAKCDGHQALTIKQFREAIPLMRRVAEAVGRWL